MMCLVFELPAQVEWDVLVAAGYMQWKQLLVLLLGCVSGPLESHTELFVALLTTLTAQMQLGLRVDGLSSTQAHRGAARSGSSAADDSCAEGFGAALLGAGLVEELLPDSFLKQSFRGFFEMLQESAPADLLMQVRQGYANAVLVDVS